MCHGPLNSQQPGDLYLAIGFPITPGMRPGLLGRIAFRSPQQLRSEFRSLSHRAVLSVHGTASLSVCYNLLFSISAIQRVKLFGFSLLSAKTLICQAPVRRQPYRMKDISMIRQCSFCQPSLMRARIFALSQVALQLAHDPCCAFIAQ